MPLTDAAVRNAKSGDKPIRLYDDRGMYLEIAPSGGKWWRLKYRLNGKEKRVSLGVYPDVSLRDARNRRDDARKLISNGIDPSEHRKSEKLAQELQTANSFRAVASEWFTKYASTWAHSHATKIQQRLEKDIFPWLGSKSISEITAKDILAVLRRIEARGAHDTAHRANQNCGQVFRYGIATGRCERNPSTDLREALAPVKREHFPAITDPGAVAELLRAIDAFQGTFVVQCALLLAPLLFVRPGELRTAEWSQLDLSKREWRYVVSKTGTEHLVPLSQQAVRILRDLQALTGRQRYVFPGRDPKKPMSGAAVNAALRRLGYDTKTEITGHGFRAMARTILHQDVGISPEVIEHQLAHRVPDRLGGAYNRTRFLKERRDMMQRWADYLDSLKASRPYA